ncbi:MAG: CusA/CzcA family heavy metal efflux RND transporter [bacterium]|nr:CusA/CzcA family heavy metal efflux RND transporter [bacterium]
MINRLVEYSLNNRIYVILATLTLCAIGGWSVLRLPIDAVPDITSPQVQINTSVPALAPEEIEKLVTFPIESNMMGLPSLVELRSLSRFGLSQVTMTFADKVDIYRIRQLVSERLQGVISDLPNGVEVKLAPISTGLSEIFYYTVRYKQTAQAKPADPQAQLLKLSFVHDYLVKPLLRGTAGVAEVNSVGGHEKEIVITPNIQKLASLGITTKELADRLRENTENAGGGFVNIGSEQIIIRSNTRVASNRDILSLPLKFGSGIKALTVGEVAEISIGSSFRTGAATAMGEEAVVGAVIMLLGENTRMVANSVREKLSHIQEKLPPDLEIITRYDRGDLVSRTIETVQRNLFEGALLVVIVLFAMLGNFRAAFIVALAIPLSMLFAISGMVQSRTSGNLMSLGAVDFGLIVDGAVVMVENILRHLAHKQKEIGRSLTSKERLSEVLYSAKEVAHPMFFGVLIITIVYIPILALAGIEGKMFHPMAYTIVLALIGALVLALTLMPVLCSYFLFGKVRERDSIVVRIFRAIYRPILLFSIRFRLIIVTAALVLMFSSAHILGKLGSEFIPQLDEGTIVFQMVRSSSLSLDASLDMQEQSENALLKHFPEISHIFSKIGTAEIASDPMGPNVSDTFISLTEEKNWRKVNGEPIGKPELIELMKRVIEINVPGQTLLASQPIQLRFNEIMAGARANLALKIYGPEFEELESLAALAMEILKTIPESGEVELDALGRVPMLEVSPDRDAMQRLNVSALEINEAVAIALAGERVGSLIEESRPIPLLVRLAETQRRDVENIRSLPVRTEDGGIVPLERVAKVTVSERIGSIARESNQRRLTILINPASRDIEGLVKAASIKLKKSLNMRPGYYFEFGGQFENLQQAKTKLAFVVPVTLLVIFVLIYLSFNCLRQALLIFLCVPLAATGGIFALYLRGLPFSISAAVGFIALSGIAVLNGLMLISFTNQLRSEGLPLKEAMIESALTRLRPKLMTALVASLGLLPMAIAQGAGAEVQRPLATVVIGGIITSTFLTLVLLPTLYIWIEQRGENKGEKT